MATADPYGDDNKRANNRSRSRSDNDNDKSNDNGRSCGMTTNGTGNCNRRFPYGDDKQKGKQPQRQ